MCAIVFRPKFCAKKSPSLLCSAFTMLSIHETLSKLIKITWYLTYQHCRGRRRSTGRCEQQQAGSLALGLVGWLLACLTSQQHASASQGRICSGNLRAATLRKKLQIKLSTSQYTDTRPTSPSADPKMPGALVG